MALQQMANNRWLDHPSKIRNVMWLGCSTAGPARSLQDTAPGLGSRVQGRGIFSGTAPISFVINANVDVRLIETRLGTQLTIDGFTTNLK